MNAALRMEVEWQCRNLCYEFAYCMDGRRYGELTALFTQDGVFNRVGQVLKGREAILEALQNRSTELRTRHLCHNVHFLTVTPERANALVYNTTLVGQGDPQGQPVLYAMSQGAFLEFRDEYHRTPEGWKIAERVATTVLTPPDMPQHR